MKLYKKAAFIATLLVTCFLTSGTGQSLKHEGASYREKTVIVKLKPQNPSLKIQPSIDHKDFRKVLAALGTDTIEPLFKDFTTASLKKRGLPEHSLSRVFVVKYKNEERVLSACERFSKSAIVDYAEPYYYFSVDYVPSDTLIGNGIAIDTLQYYLERVKAFDAWDITKGNPNIVIGIVDDGNHPHEDLTDNLKYNENDPIDGIDNDNDGYIDNYNGWDIADDDSDPFGHSHGVAVTGTCCSKPDNTKGLAGTGFNSRYIPIKASADMINGMPNFSNLITDGYEGLLYAADHGCQVINLSWGSGGRSQLLEELVNYVVLEKDVVIVGAAGNAGNEEAFYPAAYENVLAVAACSTFFSTEYNDWVETKADFSTYGTFVDICAPGWRIFTTGGANNYYYTNGTSFSSPIVAGAAALVRAKFPDLSAIQVMERLRVTADVIDTFSFNVQYKGKLGRGKLNMHKALLNAALPSVRLKKEVVKASEGDELKPGGKGVVLGNLVNYLDNTQNLYVKLSSDYEGLVIDSSVFYAGAIASMDTIALTEDQFSFRLPSIMLYDQVISFKMEFIDSSLSYYDIQYLSIIANRSYVTHDKNEIRFSIGKTGRLGYMKQEALGEGFVYKDQSLLFEGGLIAAYNSSKVSDCVRISSNAINTSFYGLNHLSLIDSLPETDQEFGVTISDYEGLVIDQYSLASSRPSLKKVIFLEYRISNLTGENLKDLYVGLFTDWDVGSSAISNSCHFDMKNKIILIHGNAGGEKYTGLAVISSDSIQGNCINNNGDGIIPNDGFMPHEKHAAISTTTYISIPNKDVSSAMGIRLDLDTLQIDTIAFALLVGESLEELVNMADSARHFYSHRYLPEPLVVVEEPELKAYPNPFNDQITINVGSLMEKICEIRLRSTTGQTVYHNKITVRSEHFTLHLPGLQEGMYILDIISGDKLVKEKFVKFMK